MINKKLLTIIIIIVNLLLFGVYYIFFYSSANNPQGEESISLNTTIIEGTGVNIECRSVRENYRKGNIEIRISFRKGEECNDEKIYLNIFATRKQLPEDFLEKSYIEGDNLSKRGLSINEEEKIWYPYYFDLSGSSDDEPNVVIYLYIGEDFFPIDKEMIKFSRIISFPKDNSAFKEDATIEFLFPSEWEVALCREAYWITKRDRQQELFKYIPTGTHRILSQPEPQGLKNMDYLIDLDRAFGRISLKDTKTGILLGVIIAVISLDFAFFTYYKREGQNNNEEGQNNEQENGDRELLLILGVIGAVCIFLILRYRESTLAQSIATVALVLITTFYAYQVRKSNKTLWKLEKERERKEKSKKEREIENLRKILFIELSSNYELANNFLNEIEALSEALREKRTIKIVEHPPFQDMCYKSQLWRFEIFDEMEVYLISMIYVLLKTHYSKFTYVMKDVENLMLSGKFLKEEKFITENLDSLKKKISFDKKLIDCWIDFKMNKDYQKFEKETMKLIKRHKKEKI